MDTSRLKRFAPQCRADLIEQVEGKLDYVLTAQTPDLAEQESLLKNLRRVLEYEGRGALVERVAYTWFNRFAAFRYLDARGWHPFRVRVITAPAEGDVLPELLQQVRKGVLPDELRDFVSLERVNALLDGQLPSSNPQAEVQRLLVIGVSQYYAHLLPGLFDRVDAFAELLLPDDLLTEHSVVQGFVSEIFDGDCDEVEVLGWLYQFYISDKKDAVMARKKAVPSEDIPAVTQLFTPHWIVRYLVENSLGRLWLRSRPDSGLRDHMPYYVEDPEQEELPPKWQEDWSHQGMEMSEGDYRTFMWLRPNRELKDQYTATLSYAMTIDGYAFAREQWRIENPESGEASEKLDELKERGWSTLGFEELRCALFLYQRAIKWTDDHDGGLTVIYHEIYDAVCDAWDREWKDNGSRIPQFEELGIRLETASESESLTVESPEEIRLLDPACGSGHMLTYAFDLLVKIYEEEGHAPSEIPEKILTHNLYGLEICPRAAQLSQFALLCKAREQSRGAFRRPVQPQVMCLRDVVLTPEEMQAWSAASGVKLSQDELAQIHQFREHTETFGALIQPVLDGDGLVALREKIGEEASDGDLLVQSTHRKLRLVLDQADMLSQRYQVVVANPPYMGSGSMNETLANFLSSNLREGKADSYGAFLTRNLTLPLQGGFVGMITIPNWMFIGSFAPLRETVFEQATILSLIHCGRGIWGSDFGSCAFIISIGEDRSFRGEYRKLFKKQGEVQALDKIESNFFDRGVYRPHLVSSSSFRKIVGAPLAYWIGNYEIFDLPVLRERVVSGGRIKTHDGPRFIRFHWEVPRATKRWRLFLKGGDFRKHYGNELYSVDWSDSAVEFYDEHGGLTREEFRNKEGICWSKITVSVPSFRIKREESEYDSASPTIFTSDYSCDYQLLAYLNSRVAVHVLSALNPTVNTQVADVLALPFEGLPDTKAVAAEQSEKHAVMLARADWDNFETSWDFRDLPLLRPDDWEVEPGHPGGPWKGHTLADSWDNYSAYCTAAIRRMQELETENNRLWIDAYGLQDELTPEVPEDEITLARADRKKDMTAFVSYAVGCMMGRYSLDRPGLILADAGDTLEQYFEKVGKGSGPLDAVRALAEPETIALAPDARPKCFSCGAELQASEARFILADLYDREPDQICGRPMIYCAPCTLEKRERIAHDIPLVDFSLAKALHSKWAEPETFQAFLEMTKCFGHRRPAQPDEVTFLPDDDAIIPITEDEWFEDDAAGRVAEFLRVTFGPETLERNLAFLEESLGKSLRKYFTANTGGFYADHIKTYKKRPIYWLFESPKKHFRALVYLHRYDKDTVNRILNGYLREFRHKITHRIDELQSLVDAETATPADRKALDKSKAALKDVEDYEREILLPLARQQIEIDLDDGVKANYPKFGKALAKVAGLS